MKDQFSVTELADILEVYPETIRRWQRCGKLHGSMTSRKTGFIFDICDVIKFVESDPHGKYLKRWNGYLGRTCDPWQKPKPKTKNQKPKTEEEIFKDCVRTIVHEELVRILKEGLGS